MQTVAKNRGDCKTERTPFLKFYTSDWVVGTQGLGFEEKGFYFELLIRMWDRKGPVPDDDAWLAGAIHCNPRTVRKLKAALVHAGKLSIDAGFITNTRMMRDIKTHLNRSNSARSRDELELNSARIGSELPSNETENQAISTHVPAKQNTPIFQKSEVRSQKEESKPARLEPEPAPCELAGLNGATHTILSDVQAWMHGGDAKSARQWLSTTTAIYGGPVVKDAYAKLKTDLATGALVASPLQTLVRIAQRMKAEPAPQAGSAPKSTIMEAIARRQAADAAGAPL